MYYLSVRNKEDLQLKIIPFFTQYSINSEKHSDFIHFASAVSILYANKGKGLKNLTPEQREHLDFCISQMNKNRYSPS
jgi:LAGLIDADG endonuclease